VAAHEVIGSQFVHLNKNANPNPTVFFLHASCIDSDAADLHGRNNFAEQYDCFSILAAPVYLAISCHSVFVLATMTILKIAFPISRVLRLVAALNRVLVDRSTTRLTLK